MGTVDVINLKSIHLQQPECATVSKIMHQIGHAIGLWHEQNRPDRDEYVKIKLENVKEGKEGDFRKRTWDMVDTNGLQYDYASIMHSPRKKFSKNRKFTIVVTNQEVYEEQCRPNLGKAVKLSDGDITVINRLYECKA